MRTWVVATVGLTVLVGAAVGAQAYAGTHREGTDVQRVAALRAEWDHDATLGVPASLLDPLRARVDHRGEAPWWSLTWWTRSPQRELDKLQADTEVAWRTAMDTARGRAQQVIDRADRFVSQAGKLAPSGMGKTLAEWKGAVQAAATPAALEGLAHTDATVLDAAEADVARARAAAAAELAALQQAGGPDGLLGQVAELDAKAQAANLDATAMDALGAQLHDLLATGKPSDAVAGQLATAIQAFRQTLALNDSISAAVRPLTYDVSQAVVEGTPNAGSFELTDQAVRHDFAAARTQVQLLSVKQTLQQLQAQVSAELAANTCGHKVQPGKDIVISLAMQELVAYQDGCAVRATPVTTGRPALPTPAGDYHVFLRTSPWTMHSPWGAGSGFWYPDTVVTWVLEFREGGYFLHDADWENPADYGPGSQNNEEAASHGCIHIPTPFMKWLYEWTPVGTPVQVVQ
jgi:lipoprotein-anchoring transpeptidase ErfK/SrfK